MAEPSSTRSQKHVSKTEAVSEKGMVTAMHGLAAEAGLSVLQAGGNAVDAAIATHLASGVVEPFMSGVGGTAYAVFHDQASGSTRCYDGSATVPRAAREDMFELVPASATAGLYGWHPTKDNASEVGPRAIGVPGAVACLGKLHAAGGRLPWEVLFEPAIQLAESGFAVDEYYFTNAAAAEPQLRRFPETAAIFLKPDGTAPYPPDGRLRQPALAETFRTLARDGVRAFYRGQIADAIVDFVKGKGGILDRDDFSDYLPLEGVPEDVAYGGYTARFLGAGSGGPTVARALGIVADRDVAALAFEDSRRFTVIAEALKTSFSERLAKVPDPPTQHTTHINVVDSQRNMVALTATLGARFGSGVAVPTLGVVLNNGMMWFDPEPGRPQSIRPGARALHAAAPCLLFRGERPRAALGAPGARRIMSALLQVLLAMIDHGMGPQAAVEAPRIHCEAGTALTADARLPHAILDALRSTGYAITVRSDDVVQSHFGRPSVILVETEPHRLRGGVEAHRSATAIGY